MAILTNYEFYFVFFGKKCQRRLGARQWQHYHRVDHPVHKYLNHFVAARDIRASAALGELTLMIPSYRTDEFSSSFLPAAGLM